MFDELSFRVDRRLVAVKVVGAVALLLLALLRGLFGDDTFSVTAAAFAGLVVSGYAVRDLVAPVRLAADLAGVTVVTGFAGRRRLAWDQIERVRVDTRSRLGTRSELLEIDVGDTLHLFSGYDLGRPCWEAAEALAALRSRVQRADDGPGRQTDDGPGLQTDDGPGRQSR